MNFKFVLIFLVSWSYTKAFPQDSVAGKPSPENAPEDVAVDQDVAETNLLGSLTSLASSSALSPSSSDDLNSYPYEGTRESIYGTFASPQPSLGISINTRALLGPQVEVLHLLEDSFNLSSDLLRRGSSFFHENYELFRLVCNIVVKKVTGLQSFFVKGISILRKILEFALNLFNNYSITLPSITLGSSDVEGAPHATYGVPPHLNSTDSFQ